jgi:hypothetical protein
MKIKEILLDKFLETKIFEMAYSRQRAWEVVHGKSKPLTDHIIKLLTMPNARDRYHWVNEINVWIEDIQDIILKPGNSRLKERDYANWLIYEPEHNIEKTLGRLKKQYSGEFFEIPTDLTQNVQSILLRISKDVARYKDRNIDIEYYLN